MGRVNFKRHQYAYKDEEGFTCYVFLLNKGLELFSMGKISCMLIEIVAKQATTQSFRNAAEAVSKTTAISCISNYVWQHKLYFSLKLPLSLVPRHLSL